MKKYKILLTGLLIATFVLPTSVAKAFENNNEINISSNIIEPLDVGKKDVD